MLRQMPDTAPPSLTQHPRCVRVLFEYPGKGRAILDPIKNAPYDIARTEVWEESAASFDGLFQKSFCEDCYSWATDRLHEAFLGAKDLDPRLFDAATHCPREEN